MPFNPQKQGRQAGGKFGASTGVTQSGVTATSQQWSQAMSQAATIIAQQQAQLAQQKTLTKSQRAYLRQLHVAAAIIKRNQSSAKFAANKAKALARAKATKAKAAAAKAAAAKARGPAALKKGVAAGKSAPARGTPKVASAKGTGKTPVSTAQLAQVRQYMTGR